MSSKEASKKLDATSINAKEAEDSIQSAQEEHINGENRKEERKKFLSVLFAKTSEKDKKVSDKEKMEALMELAIATEELRQLKKEYGIEDQLSESSKKFSRKQQEPILVNKKKYIWLAFLTGWFGGHRFYVKHYKIGLIYLLFSWAGIGLYHSMVDIMVAIPMKPDENGNIML